MSSSSSMSISRSSCSESGSASLASLWPFLNHFNWMDETHKGDILVKIEVLVNVVYYYLSWKNWFHVDIFFFVYWKNLKAVVAVTKWYLLTKIVLFSDRTKTIYSNSEMSEQFLTTECFLTFAWRFLRSN